jgi:hypothetical protein
MDEEDILWSLKIISMIKEGQKLRVRRGRLDVHEAGNVFNSVLRWIRNDNRQTSLTYISNIINRGIKENCDKRALREALGGLNALKVTYSTDINIVARILVLEEKIMYYIEHGKFIEKLQPQNNGGILPQKI